MNNKIVVGCDIGGSHISTALVDLENKSLIADTFKRQTVNSHEATAAIIDSWSSCIKASLKKGNLGNVMIGIAIPGPFDYEKGVSLMKNQDKYEALFEVNVKVLLAERLAIEPEKITFLNDAACFLQGEMFAGAGVTFKRAVGLTLGTGLGSALFLNGHAEDGDLWCAKFKEGIAEDYLSGRWLKDTYSKRTGRHVESVKVLCDLAETETDAKNILCEFGFTLAEFIAEHLSDRKPEGLILGGNIAKGYRHFLSHAQKGLQQKGIFLPIEIAQLGEMAAIYGAAGALKKTS